MATPPYARALVVLGAHESARRHVGHAFLDSMPGADFITADEGEGWTVRQQEARSWSPPTRPLSAVQVIDAWSGADPAPLVEAATAPRNGSPGVCLGAVITVVDARMLTPDLLSGETATSRGLGSSEDDRRTVADVLLRQIDYADHVAVIGATETSPAGLMCRSLISHLNPSARLLPEVTRKTAAELLQGRFDNMAALERISPAFPPLPPEREAADDEPVQTAVWHRSEPLHPERFFEALDEMTATSVRSRGRLWMATEPNSMVTWEAAGSSVSLERGGSWASALAAEERHIAAELRSSSGVLDRMTETGDRCQFLAFTGLGLDSDRLFRLLDSCLLNGEEQRAWEQDGPQCEDPFQPLLTDPGSTSY